MRGCFRGRAGDPALTEEEFVESHGSPPWDFVNRAIEDAGLDFAIDYPTSYTTESFTPRLKKLSTGETVNFSSLSSGERILMSLAFCVYYAAADDRNAIERPKLVLFDEIDAPLHPSMSRTLLSVIQKSIVDAAQTRVILTTHSPSTVAVAEEAMLYLMEYGKPGLHKVGKRQAIAALTRELPTLSIDVDGRRQVFVESGYDVERFELLYRTLAPQLRSERSLTFIAAGAGRASRQKGDGGGSSRVKKVVADLVENGNRSVFGVLDWDGINRCDGHVMVLAEDRRYSIENCLLDPLLVLALLLREDRDQACSLGLPEGTKFVGFGDLEAPALQPAIDAVQRKVLGLEDGADLKPTVDVDYLGGLRLQVAGGYLEMKGHELEDRVKEAFPVLKRFHQTEALQKAVIEHVIVEMTHLPPREIFDLFDALLSFEDE